MGVRSGAMWLVAGLLLCGPASARAARVIDLGAFTPNALNNHQQIVGDTSDQNNDTAPGHAALWRDGVLTPLSEPAGTYQSDAYWINASGRIGGDSKDNASQVHALYWDGPADTAHRLGPFWTGPDDFSFAAAVDTAGEIVGGTLDTGAAQVGFLSNGGALTRVGQADADGGSTYASAITPDGTHILGHVATANHNGAANGWYLWPSPAGGGVKLDITPFQHGSLILGSATVAQYGNDLASDGAVLGYTGVNPNRVFYIRLPDGSEDEVDGLIGHNGINARHQVIGTILADDGQGHQIPHAALWKPDGTVVDLNTLLPANSGFILFDGLAINDNGDIVGLAAHNNKTVGFLLPAGFTVDSTGDQPDTTPGDGACLTAQTTCTLRAALQEVSGGTASDPTSVAFNLPGNATTITPATPLPAVTKPIAIDGGTNPGGRVVLQGSGAGSGASGLRLQGDKSSVRGMDIEHFDAAGIRIQGRNMVIGGLASDVPPCAFPCNIIKSNTGPAIAVDGASTGGGKLQGNRLVGNGRPAIDLGGDGRTPNDALDADTGPNGLQNFPIGVLSEKDPVSGVVKVSGVDVPSEAGDTIDVYAQSSVDQARGAEPADYVGTTTVENSGGWELDLPPGLPAADTFFSATVTTLTDDTSELSPICGDPNGHGTPDSDGDGLCDDWELHGIDANDDGVIDLPLQDGTYGATPGHKDLYLELDAMAPGPHGVHAPSAGAVQDVVTSFANAPVENATGGPGIALHVNPGRPTVDDTVPEAPMDVAGTGPGTMDYIRDGTDTNPCDGAFGTHDERAAPDCFARLAARALAFRWVVFSDSYNEDPGSSGFSAGIGGTELTVSLGNWPAAGVLFGGGGIARCHTLAACRQVVDAGTLMHEFGHSLGLHHGGRDDVNNKPNYLSVMNYLYQMGGRAPGRPLDYSRFALPSLDETSLNDNDGIAVGAGFFTRLGVAARWPRIAFYNSAGGSCALRGAASDGPVDWDGNAPVLVSSTLIHSRTCAGAKATLKATEDWPDLRYSFRDQQGALRTPVYAGDTAVPAREETSQEVLEIAARSDVDGNGVNDLADACREAAGSEVADANGNGFADICEADMTRLQAFPNQQNGSGGGQGGPAKDTTPPTLAKLSARPPTVTRARKHHKAKAATLTFSVSEASTVTFTGEAQIKGRLKGRRCVAGGSRGKACLTYRKLGGTLRVNAKAGTNSVPFAAKLGRTKLAAGTYRLTAVAIDAAGNRSKAVTVLVTVR